MSCSFTTLRVDWSATSLILYPDFTPYPASGSSHAKQLSLEKTGSKPQRLINECEHMATGTSRGTFNF